MRRFKTLSRFRLRFSRHRSALTRHSARPQLCSTYSRPQSGVTSQFRVSRLDLSYSPVVLGVMRRLVPIRPISLSSLTPWEVTRRLAQQQLFSTYFRPRLGVTRRFRVHLLGL